MENTEKKEFEFSLVWFLETFRGKFKIIVIVGIIASLLGGTLGVLSVTAGDKVYGNTLAFQFPTPEQTGYSNVIQLLESDLFAENILIGTKSVEKKHNDKTVTIKIPDLKYGEGQQAEVEALELTKLEQAEKIKALKDELKEIPYELNLLKSELDEKKNEHSTIIDNYNRLYDIYSDKLVEDAGVSEQIKALQGDYDKAMAEINKIQQQYDDANKLLKEKEKELFEAEKALAEATEKSEEIIGALRATWISDPKNRELVEIFRESVTYSFTKDGSALPAASAGKEDTSGKFLYINVEIPNDQKLADTIISNILSEIDAFVVSNTTPLEKNDEIKCIRLSSGEAKNINNESLISSVIKFALIAVIAAEGLAFATIIIAQLKRTFFPDSDKNEIKKATEAADDSDKPSDEDEAKPDDQ